MQSLLTSQLLTDLLLKISEGEREIEILRQILCEQDDFEPYAAFKRIDRSSTGFLSASDFLHFLSENEIFHLEQHASTFVKRYDIDDDSRLKYSEFLSIVLPANNPTLRAKVAQRPSYRVKQDQTLPYQAEFPLTKVIDKEISFYTVLDSYKKTLYQNPGFSYYEAFRSLDIGHIGRLSLSSFRDFLKTQDVFAADEDLKALMRRLDKDNDGFISFEEFVESIKPHDQTSPIKSSPPRDFTGTRNRLKSPLRAAPTREEPAKYVSQSLRKEPINRLHSPLRGITGGATTTTMARSLASADKGILSPTRRKYSKYAAKEYSRRAREIIEGPSIMQRITSPERKREENIGSRVAAISEQKRSAGIYTSGKKKEEVHNENLEGTIRTLSPELKKFAEEKKTVEEGSKTTTFAQEKEIMDYLKQVVNLEKEIEAIKKELDEREDFSLLELFKTFDKNHKGFVTEFQIEEGMKSLGVYPTKDELYLFIRRFDKENLDQLKFIDFGMVFEPKVYGGEEIKANKRGGTGQVIFEKELRERDFLTVVKKDFFN